LPAADPWLPDLLASRGMAIQATWQTITQCDHPSVTTSSDLPIRYRRPQSAECDPGCTFLGCASLLLALASQAFRHALHDRTSFRGQPLLMDVR
jgi:hypothetical protein